jgi:hypothetical protein
VIARGASDQLPGWMGSIQDATPAKGVRLALLLSVANPKVVLLAAAAGLDIGATKATAAGVVLTAVLFTMVASISVAVPVLTYAVVGDRVLTPAGEGQGLADAQQRGPNGRCHHRHRPGAAQERPERALTLPDYTHSRGTGVTQVPAPRSAALLAGRSAYGCRGWGTRT